MTSLRLFRALMLLGCASCSVIEIAPPPDVVAVNECESDDDCGSGNKCDSGACAARHGEISALIVEVTPPSDAPSSGGVPFYVHVDDLAGADIAIKTLIKVSGRVSKPAGSGADGVPCAFTGVNPNYIVREAVDGTVPVDVTFLPSERVVGIGVTPYSTSVPLRGYEGTNPGQAEEHHFEAALPPGDYDIYIEPRPSKDPACQLLPLLLRKQHVAGGNFEARLPPATVMPILIRIPELDSSLEGWTLDMLDPVTGRELAVPATIGPMPDATGGVREYLPELRFSTAFTSDADSEPVPDTSGLEVVRLSPSNPATAPVLLYQRSGLAAFAELGEPALIDLTLSDATGNRPAIPPFIMIHGATARLDNHSPVEATVELTALDIAGLDPPQPASFVATRRVGADGLFDAAVPPGRYRVSAIPKPELGLATAYADWTIAAEPADQSGRTIEFGAPAFISGTALLSPSGSAFGASVRASATPWKIQENVLEAEFGASPKIPFASGGIVGEAGRFEISAEEGTYDFSVQPETRSNFPWYVRPATEVTPDGRSLDFRVPLPVIYRGRVMIGDEGAQATVPSALLRVYAYVTLEGKYSVTPTESVVQIAEARANESGAFTLLIPASLDSRR